MIKNRRQEEEEGDKLQRTRAMPLAVLPVASVGVAAVAVAGGGPAEDAKAGAHVLLPLAVVAPAVGHDARPSSMALVLLPLALVHVVVLQRELPTPVLFFAPLEGVLLSCNVQDVAG